jgi:hypothetical protein
MAIRNEEAMMAEKPTQEEIKKLLEDWDKGGGVKTSLYYRLQSMVYSPKSTKG